MSAHFCRVTRYSMCFVAQNLKNINFFCSGFKVSEVTFAELNGISGKCDFIQRPRLSQRLAAQLAKPFKFEHINGHVRQIQAAPDVTETTVNIVRGMLSFFHATVKTSPTVYELEEVSHQLLIFFSLHH